jgi:hypothetical protein
MKQTILVILALLLTACSGLVKVVPENNLTPFPKKPEFTTMVDKPIVSKSGENYVVVPEFIKRTTAEHIHLEKIYQWKSTNGVKE